MKYFQKLKDGECMAKAGEYYLGDPCYQTQKLWMDLLQTDCNYFMDSAISCVRDELEVLSFGTKHGDGCYNDQFGNSYGVDAGMIGLTPVSQSETKDSKYSKIVKFEHDVLCYATDDGKLVFGEYVIDTDPEYDDYDYV